MSVWFTILLSFILFLPQAQADGDNKPKKKGGKEPISRLGEYRGFNLPRKQKHPRYLGQYVAMPDSVRLATDVFLPAGLKAGEQVPTLVYFVRYGRSLALKFPFSLFARKPFHNPHVPKAEVAYFTRHGYACVVVDLRGSGASFGTRSMEFSPEEVQDMYHLLDWIVAQPWSDGKTATTGISYTGTTAELALSTGHPSLKACIPRCNIFDLYTDMNFPGGIRQAPFIEVWKKTTNALDQNNFGVFGGMAKTAVKGISPIPKSRKILPQALAEHEGNFDIFAGLFKVELRDDVEPETGLGVDVYSVHRLAPKIEALAVPIYRISGWYDGANIASLFKGYLNTNNTKRILVGPWDHGPVQFISPFDSARSAVDFNVYAEMLRFLDFHVLGIQNGIDQEPPVHYYQMGEEAFRSASTWPLPETQYQTWLPNAQGQLQASGTAVEAGQRDYVCDYTLGTGGGARWNSLTPLFRYEKKISYGNRAERNARMLCFDGPVLSEAKELTGHAEVKLFLSSDTTEAFVFAYLEDVAPDGRVTYITEGQLRACHRGGEAGYIYPGPQHSYCRADQKPLVPGEVVELAFEFLPISYRLPAGHRLRLSLAAADVDHFELPKVRPEKIRFHFGENYPAELKIPVIPSKIP